MADSDISSKSGEQFSISGQATKPANIGDPAPWPNYPSNATGFAIVFTAKRKKDDAVALVQHDNGPITVSGTTYNKGGASLANGGAWTVSILRADTVAFTKAEELVYDVWLMEPDGTRTQVADGEWEIGKSVGP